MSESIYGFINENSRVIDFFVVMDGDSLTSERLKEECGAHSYHKVVNPSKEILGAKEDQYWNGQRFIWDPPYPSWIFSDEINMWVPPIIPPAFDPENPKNYVWNEELLNWEEVSE